MQMEIPNFDENATRRINKKKKKIKRWQQAKLLEKVNHTGTQRNEKTLPYQKKKKPLCRQMLQDKKKYIKTYWRKKK